MVKKFGYNQPVKKYGRFWSKIAKKSLKSEFWAKISHILNRLVFTEFVDSGYSNKLISFQINYVIAS